MTLRPLPARHISRSAVSQRAHCRTAAARLTRACRSPPGRDAMREPAKRWAPRAGALRAEERGERDLVPLVARERIAPACRRRAPAPGTIVQPGRLVEGRERAVAGEDAEVGPALRNCLARRADATATELPATARGQVGHHGAQPARRIALARVLDLLGEDVERGEYPAVRDEASWTPDAARDRGQQGCLRLARNPGHACSSSARICSSRASGSSPCGCTRIAGSAFTRAGYPPTIGAWPRSCACRSIGGPCARLASTPSTGAASTIPRGSGARRRARSTGTCRRSACSTATRGRRRAGSPAASSTPATTRSTATSTAGRGDQPALIYDSPVTGHAAHASPTRELRDEVARLAGALRGLGVERGDRVVIYMPMVPEAVVAMLACARLGAVHSVVFGGFAAPELAARIDDARPSVVLSA